MKNILVISNKIKCIIGKILSYSSNFLRMRNLKYLIIAVIFSACTNSENKFVIDDYYKTKVDVFFKDKLIERQGNYLPLTALYRLEDNVNSFGKDEENNLTLKIDDVPNIIGTVTINNNFLSFKSAKNVDIKTKEDSIVTELVLQLDQYGSSQKLYHNQLSWQIITRSKQHYLRVWDSENPAINAFKGFQKFELNNNFIFNADFTYYEKEKSEIVKAEVDGKRSTSFIGKLTFMYDNEIHTLEVGSEGFTMVGDATTGETTYGGGRYIYLKLPDANGKVILDFNKLYNPPCAFSEFTTCLYPPRQNHLSFKILAGEKIKFIN